MLALAHTYITTKVTGRDNPLLILGGILPDISTSNGKIDRTLLHESPNEFYSFVQSKFSELIDLAIGVKMHADVGKGADHYCDNREIGYAMKNGEFLNNSVADLLEIEPDQSSYILSHNFIEAALDTLIVRHEHQVFEIYKKNYLEVFLDDVSKCLSLYVGEDVDTITEELKRFMRVLRPEIFETPEDLIDYLALPMIELRFGKIASREKALAILDSAIMHIESTFEKFLADTVRSMKEDFSEFVLV